MSYTDNVATFLGSLDSFYESVPTEDLELLVGPVLERIRSQPGSPLSGSPLGLFVFLSHTIKCLYVYLHLSDKVCFYILIISQLGVILSKFQRLYLRVTRTCVACY